MNRLEETVTEHCKALNERATKVLNHIIQNYVVTGQPVASTVLAKASDLKVSPATVRNVMSDLEDLGLLHSPHTSAGRVPTSAGLSNLY